ncbi:MAG: hypothetical protein AAGI15_00190 [Pseudomonadota bacterium]
MPTVAQCIGVAVMGSLGTAAAFWQAGWSPSGGSPALVEPAPSAVTTPAAAPAAPPTAAPTIAHVSTPIAAPTGDRQHTQQQLAELTDAVAALTAALNATQARLEQLEGSGQASVTTATSGVDAEDWTEEDLAAMEAQAQTAFDEKLAAHGLQRADGDWEQTVSMHVTERLASLQLEATAAQILDTDCRESLCRVRFSAADDQVRSMLPILLASADLGAVELRHSGDGDGTITEALLQR